MRGGGARGLPEEEVASQVWGRQNEVLCVLSCWQLQRRQVENNKRLRVAAVDWMQCTVLELYAHLLLYNVQLASHLPFIPWQRYL